MEIETQAEQILVVTKWGVRWLKHAWNICIHGSRKEQFAKAVLQKLDGETGSPEEHVDLHVYTSEHKVYSGSAGSINVGTVERKRVVVRKGKRSAFAASLAQLAYNKFGERKMTEANLVSTRKWIQKQLEDPKYKDLRVCDKNIAIDRALFLSFVPTNDFRKMKLAVSTKAWADRCDNEGVFGKVFRLVSRAVGSSSPDLELIE